MTAPRTSSSKPPARASSSPVPASRAPSCRSSRARLARSAPSSPSSAWPAGCASPRSRTPPRACPTGPSASRWTRAPGRSVRAAPCRSRMPARTPPASPSVSRTPRPPRSGRRSSTSPRPTASSPTRSRPDRWRSAPARRRASTSVGQVDDALWEAGTVSLRDQLMVVTSTLEFDPRSLEQEELDVSAVPATRDDEERRRAAGPALQPRARARRHPDAAPGAAHRHQRRWPTGAPTRSSSSRPAHEPDTRTRDGRRAGHDASGPSSFGGAEGTRTPDPLHAMQVRYQLRHSPVRVSPRRSDCVTIAGLRPRAKIGGGLSGQTFQGPRFQPLMRHRVTSEKLLPASTSSIQWQLSSPRNTASDTSWSSPTRALRRDACGDAVRHDDGGLAGEQLPGDVAQRGTGTLGHLRPGLPRDPARGVLATVEGGDDVRVALTHLVERAAPATHRRAPHAGGRRDAPPGP